MAKKTRLIHSPRKVQAYFLSTVARVVFALFCFPKKCVSATDAIMSDSKDEDGVRINKIVKIGCTQYYGRSRGMNTHGT